MHTEIDAYVFCTSSTVFCYGQHVTLLLLSSFRWILVTSRPLTEGVQVVFGGVGLASLTEGVQVVFGGVGLALPYLIHL